MIGGKGDDGGGINVGGGGQVVGSYDKNLLSLYNIGEERFVT